MQRRGVQSGAVDHPLDQLSGPVQGGDAVGTVMNVRIWLALEGEAG